MLGENILKRCTTCRKLIWPWQKMDVEYFVPSDMINDDIPEWKHPENYPGPDYTHEWC